MKSIIKGCLMVFIASFGLALFFGGMAFFAYNIEDWIIPVVTREVIDNLNYLLSIVIGLTVFFIPIWFVITALILIGLSKLFRIEKEFEDFFGTISY